MKKVKFTVLRDWDNSVRGYKLGKWYLMKYYHWMNYYTWVINDNGRYHYYSFENPVEMPNTFIVGSCKEGKQKLIELNKEM